MLVGVVEVKRNKITTLNEYGSSFRHQFLTSKIMKIKLSLRTNTVINKGIVLYGTNFPSDMWRWTWEKETLFPKFESLGYI